MMILLLKTERDGLGLVFADGDVLTETVDACPDVAVVTQLECLSCRGAEDGEGLTDSAHAAALAACKGGYDIVVG